jgi:NAD(P)H-dependent FMN reductase
MITILSGSPRKNSNTGKIARYYAQLLEEKNIPYNVLMLEDVDVTKRDEAFVEIEDKILKPTEKYIVLSPEYNGSFSGILKLLIDNSLVKETFYFKKALLTGVATGRAGNLRGMEHLTGCFLHMQMNVHPNRLPLSLVHTILDEEGKLTDESAKTAISNQLNEFLNF